MKDLTSTRYIVPAGNDYKYRAITWVPTGIVSIWGGSVIAALVDFGTAIPFAITSALVGASIVFGLGRKRGKSHASAINEALDEAFHTSVRIAPKSAREVADGISANLDDGENGYFEVVHSAQELPSKNGAFVISHVPGPMGLTEFDSMLIAMSGNADVKAITARLQKESVRSPLSKFTSLVLGSKDAA